MAQRSASKLRNYFASPEVFLFSRIPKFLLITIPVIEPYHEHVLHVPFPHKIPAQSLFMNKVCMFHFLTKSRHRALWTSSVWSVRSYLTSPYSLLTLLSHRPLYLFKVISFLDISQ